MPRRIAKHSFHFAVPGSILFLILTARAQQPPPTDVPYKPGCYDAITDVPGVIVGNYSVTERTHRGTTVIIPGDSDGICALSVRGSNPLTIGDSTFSPTSIGEECDAIVLTGGSAFGLATVPGVTDFLFEHGKGVRTRAGVVPIVPAAVIFDLPVGDPNVHPQRDWGYKAAEDAKSGSVPQGNVGAGAGATVGKSPGGIRLKGGLGTASAVLPSGAIVGVLVVVNALGDVVNPASGEFYATSGGFDRTLYREQFAPPAAPKGSTVPKTGENTTLVVVATNALLSKTQLTKVADLAHDGLARAIRPIHTMLDGDTVIAVSVGGDKRVRIEGGYPGEEVDRVGSATADLVVRAILNAVNAAESIPDWTSYRDWLKSRGARHD